MKSMVLFVLLPVLFFSFCFRGSNSLSAAWAGNHSFAFSGSQNGSAGSALEKARACVRAWQLEEALDTMKPFISPPGAFPELYSYYVVTLFWAGRKSEALARFKALPHGFPRPPLLLRNMARGYAETGDFNAAAALYRKILQSSTADPVALAGLAESLMLAERPDEADVIIRSHDFQLPVSLTLVLAKGRSLVAQDRCEQALDWYDQAIARLSILAGSIARARDDVIAALPAEKQQALQDRLLHRLETGDSEAGLDYMLVLALCRRFDKVVEGFEKLKYTAADLCDDKLYWIGWSYFKMEQSETAERLFKIVTQRNPWFIPARIGLVYSLAVQKRFQKARSELAALNAMEPDNPEMDFARAYLYEKQGRFWDAVRVYDNFLQRHPGHNTALRLRIKAALSEAGASSDGAYGSAETAK